MSFPKQRAQAIVLLLIMSFATLSLAGCAGLTKKIEPRPIEMAYKDMEHIWINVQDRISKDFAGVKKDGSHGLIFYKKHDPKKQQALIRRIDEYLNENVYEASDKIHDPIYAYMIKDQYKKDQYWIKLSSQLIQSEAYARAEQESGKCHLFKRVFFSHEYSPAYSVKFIDG